MKVFNKTSFKNRIKVIATKTPGLDYQVIQFFATNPSVSDSDLHEWASSNGHEPDKVEEVVYSVLGSLLKKFGKHNDVPDSEFDAQELARGIEVEMEHTDNPYVSKLIAKDHLSECSDYYTRLDKMEKECESYVVTAAKSMPKKDYWESKPDSSAIKDIRYVPDDKTLFIQFTSGSIYMYEGVDAQTFLEFHETKSAGRFFQKHIKDEFPEEKVS